MRTGAELAPAPMVPVFHLGLTPSAVAVCDAGSAFCQVTVSPSCTVRRCGWNANALIDTTWACALAGAALSRSTPMTARKALRSQSHRTARLR